MITTCFAVKRNLIFVNNFSHVMKSNIFSMFSDGERNIKPYKIQRNDNHTRFGVTADTLSTLKKKAAKKFQISERTLIVLLAEDGTEVDDEDYFMCLPPQTLFVILKPREIWEPEQNYEPSKLKSLLSTLLKASEEEHKIISELHILMKEENNPAMLELIGKVTTTMENKLKVTASDRKEDPDWFEGVESRFKTKEDVMKDRARNRIRGYLYTAKDHIKRSKGETQAKLKLLLEAFEMKLKENDYFSHYFCRSSEGKSVLCDSEGWFQCEGPFNEKSCSKTDHFINPYGSAEARLLFSTWNLDHVIEKSREILPRLVEAVNNLHKSKKKLNQMYFFDLLFTKKNLKLVHIACHDKKEHTTKKCDQKKIYL